MKMPPGKMPEKARELWNHSSMTRSLPLWLHFLADSSVFEIMQPDSPARCPTNRKGKYPGKEDGMSDSGIGAISGAFAMCIGVMSMFAFVTFAVWFGTRRKEREAFYRAENLRRIAESSGDGAKAAVELLREEEHLKRIKAREGMKIGGLVCVAAGIGLTILLLTLEGVHRGSPYMVGLIPGLIGVALLIYVFFMAEPVE
jgi:hypothetical protein